MASNGIKLSKADCLIGKTAPQYNVNTDFDDVYHISGAPGSNGNTFDWLALARNGGGNYADKYGDFTFVSTLTYRYWQQPAANEIYLQKWFEIANNFVTRQKDLVAALPAAQQNKLPTNWSQSSGNTLTQGDRVHGILTALAVLSKSLPGTEKITDWIQIGNSINSDPDPASFLKFPMMDLARIAVSLVSDHSRALEIRYVAAGAVPNQRRNGLAALLETSQMFPEFKQSTNIRDSAVTGFNDYLATGFQPDGGMLEQSFNYNVQDAATFGELSKLVKTSIPDLSNNFTIRQYAFYRMLAALNNPLCAYPGLGSQRNVNPTAIWLSATLRSAWYQTSLASRPGTDDPLVADIYNAIAQNQTTAGIPFTSVAFPYSGYYAQRRNWSWDSPYLFFVNSRSTRGHHSNPNNSIQVCAFGRPLLTYGGPDAYGVGSLPPNLQADFDKVHVYFGESSSLKSNTIVVDGTSQISINQSAQSNQAFSTTLPFNWYTSADFDYLEGDYTRGYIKPNDVEHQRKVIFVRNPGFWIVVDEVDVNDQKSHTLSQIWRFPPKISKKAYGFDPWEVKVDAAAKCVYTDQAGAPNINLYQFGSMPLSYNQYYGVKTPYYLGWSAISFTNFQPSPDAHISWTSAGKSVIITLIWPQANNSRPNIQTRDLSIAGNIGHAGVEIKLPDGRIITCLSSVVSETQKIGTISYKAKTLFTTNDGKENVGGLAIDEVSGVTPYRNFSFKSVNGTTTSTTGIQKPSKFIWADNNGVYNPILQ